MCDLLVATTTVDILDDNIKNKNVFTAFDITKEARITIDENVRHPDVRNIVNNEFTTNQMTGYNRELCTLNLSNRPQAFVYFPDTKSALDHPLVSAKVVDINDIDDVNDIDNDTDGITTKDVNLLDDEVKTTKEGRVQIPRHLLNQVTPNAGTYDIIIRGNLKCATKDARGDVRICLKQFGIDDKKVKLSVDTNSNTIIVETA